MNRDEPPRRPVACDGNKDGDGSRDDSVQRGNENGNGNDSGNADEDVAVARVLESFLVDVEQGLADPARLLADHPAISDRLQACLEVLQIAAPRDEPLPRRAPGGGLERSLGDYELLDEIARGGMGVVYRARQKSLNRLVAVKLISTNALAAPDHWRRFRAEAEALASLDHPQIVPIYEFGEADGACYFSMRLLTNGSLADRLAEYAASPRAAAVLIGQVARAVHHAHGHGVLHRDLKPSNILLDAEGRPQIADFGLAVRLNGEADLSSSGMIVGTPSFMAPEQAERRRAAVTTASDVYGLGAVLYAMLTEKPPVEGGSPTEILQRLREQRPTPPRRRNPRVDRALEAICLKCLEKDPGRRYETAADLAADLDRYLAGRPVLAQPRRRLLPARLVARAGRAAVLLVLASSGCLWLGAIQGGPPRPGANRLLQYLVGLDLPMLGIGWSTLRHRTWNSLWSGASFALVAVLLLSSHLLGLLAIDAGVLSDAPSPPLRLRLNTPSPSLVLMLLGAFLLGVFASDALLGRGPRRQARRELEGGRDGRSGSRPPRR